MLSRILDEVVTTRRKLSISTQNLRWTIINSLLALLIYLDIHYGSLVQYVDAYLPYIQFPFIMVCARMLFMLSAMFNLYKYISSKTFSTPLCVNPVLKKLFRIADGEPGFVISKPSQTTSKSPRSPVNLPPPTLSPSNYDSFASSSIMGNSLPLIDRLGNSFNTSFSPSGRRINQSSFLDTSLPVNLYEAFNTSITSEELIEDARDLHSFLHHQRSQQEDIIKMETAMHRSVCRDGLGMLSHHHSPHSHPSSPTFHLHYDLARPPHITSSNLSSPGTPSKSDPHNRSDVWSRMGVPQYRVNLWTERLRKYIRQTILSRVVTEINSVNKTLVSMGMEDQLIGVVSLAALKQLEATKSHLIPNLTHLLPFINLSNNQQYLVPRIIELNDGACMSSFRWNSGGSFKGKKWEENLPTDSSILMHLLCTYLDSCLPSLPRFSSVGSFTGQHFIKKTDKPLDLSHYKDSAYLQEVSVNPPVYDVVYNCAKLQAKKGRENCFHSILMFFYLIKTKENALLRRVSLGLNGINILWIFDN